MFTYVYRYVRYGYLRRKLRNYLLNEQHKLLDVSSDNVIDVVTFYYNSSHIEPFRKRYNLSPGEIGILLREIFWIDCSRFDAKYGIIVEWLFPLWEHYNDLEVMDVMFPTAKESVAHLQKQDEKLLSALVEYLIKKRSYLLAK